MTMKKCVREKEKHKLTLLLKCVNDQKVKPDVVSYQVNADFKVFDVISNTFMHSDNKSKLSKLLQNTQSAETKHAEQVKFS